MKYYEKVEDTAKTDRPKLTPYKDRRIHVSGLVDANDNWHDWKTHRNYRTMCLVDVEVDGALVADHVWLHRVDDVFDQVKPRKGDRIRVSALVKEYTKVLPEADENGRRTIKSYFLDHPEDVTLPDRRRFVHDRPPEPEPQPKSEPKPEQQPPPSPTGRLSFEEVIGQLKRIAGQIGWDDLAAIMKAVRPKELNKEEEVATP